MIAGASILITGGTGTFGTAFVRYLLDPGPMDFRHPPERVIIFSRDELKQAILATRADSRMRFFIGDVRDLERLRRAFQGVDYVVHAAALKRIEVGEYNPQEVIKTNILGTQNVIEAAIDCGVKRVVLLSSDKTCAPVNLYGATKLVAEKLMLAAHAYVPVSQRQSPRTSFVVVRYGNVSASRGSVIELWRAAAALEEVPRIQVTDPEATRFWMTTHQACQLVAYAIESAPANTITVPELPAYRLGDLAIAVAPDSVATVIGLRPGEKQHEAMIGPDEVSGFARIPGKGYLQAPAGDSDLRLMAPLTSDRALRLTVQDLIERIANL